MAAPGALLVMGVSGSGNWDGNSMMLMIITRRKIEGRWEKAYRSMTRTGFHGFVTCMTFY
uniref:IDNK gluconokinase n=1 Tax=Gorilla gorilla gorilla TaxID=9595 RepID=A0A2I2ZY89_GORGO